MQEFEVTMTRFLIYCLWNNVLDVYFVTFIIKKVVQSGEIQKTTERETKWKCFQWSFRPLMKRVT